MSPLRWTSKSTTQLARELTRQGHPVSPRTVRRLLKASGYSLQSNRKTKEEKGHPDRNAHVSAESSLNRRKVGWGGTGTAATMYLPRANQLSVAALRALMTRFSKLEVLNYDG